MLIGAMNHPKRDPIQEMEWMARLDLDFIDLTLEPPAASSALWQDKAPELAEGLHKYQLRVVGHTPYYLPIASPIEEMRLAAEFELRRCLEIFAALETPWVNIHPDAHVPFATNSEIEARNCRTLGDLLEFARPLGCGLMLENLPGHFNTVSHLAPLLDTLPELGLHLDLGHCNLHQPTSTATELITHYGPRIRHVHLHDNKGGTADLHLPIGTGNLKVEQELALLKSIGYDGTITLEVFSPDPHYFEYSAQRLRQLWDAL